MVLQVDVGPLKVTVAAADHQYYRNGYVLIDGPDGSVQLNARQAETMSKILDFYLTESDPPKQPFVA